MRQRFGMILTVSLLLVFAAGCGTDRTVYFERINADTERNAGGAGTEVSARQTDGAGVETEEESRVGDVCYVHVCGAVQAPGVYILPSGSRVCDAVGMAGGLTEDASGSSVNQAAAVCDGQMVYIPTKEEAESGITGEQAPSGAGVSGAGGASGGEPDRRVNLNTATAEELMTLSGIGQSKAEDIIAYREQHGGFSSPEEIMQIRGIKDGLYNRIKDDIKVK